MQIIKKSFLALIVLHATLTNCQDRFLRPEVVVPLVAALCAGYYLVTPDKRQVSLNELKIRTFLPVQEPVDGKIAKNKDAIFKVLKQGEGFLEINNKSYQLLSEIPEEIAEIKEPITLYSGGFHPTGHFPPHSVKNYKAYQAYVAIKAGLIDGPCVVYDSPYSSRLNLNFGEAQDVEGLGLLYDAILAKHKDAQIVLHGVCKGALTLISFLHHKDGVDNVNAVVLESPLLSLRHILKNYGIDSSVFHLLAGLLYPNADLAAKTVLEAETFPQVPVLIGALEHDKVTKYKDMQLLFQHLKGLDVPAEMFTSSRADLKHSKIGKDPNFVQTVKDFLQKNK